MTIYLKDMRVLVTARAFGVLDQTLKDELSEKVGEVIYRVEQPRYSPVELIEFARSMDGWIASLDVIDRTVFAAAKKLKVVSRFGVGVDNIDLKAAKEFGVVVTNTPKVNANAVAEHTVGLILSLMRKINEGILMTRKGQWGIISSPTLEGKTLGFLGFGQIGKAVAVRMSGFGMRMIAYDPVPDMATAERLSVNIVSREDLIRQSDVISLHLATTEQTRRSIDTSFFQQMKPGSYLINSARGELVDEEALFQALTTGKLAGAAVDVLAPEPPDPQNPLLQLPNLLVTPHMAAYGESAMNGMGRMALENLLRVLNGEAPIHRVI